MQVGVGLKKDQVCPGGFACLDDAGKMCIRDRYVTLREDQPVNLCGAFERAVPRSAQGYARCA